MANDCFFKMYVKGKPLDCLRVAGAAGAAPGFNGRDEFFYRMDADMSVYDSNPDHYVIEINGSCAWSLESCCRRSGYSGGKDLFSIFSKRHNVTIEAFSEESGMGFAEHYIYDKGKCLEDECVNFSEPYWDEDEYPTYEDLLAEYGDNVPPEDEISPGDCFSVGGFSMEPCGLIAA